MKEQAPPVAFTFAALLCLLMLLSIARPIPEIFFGDPGLGWHLRLGNLILQQWEFPRVDPFSVTIEGVTTLSNWIYGQWFADVVLYSSWIVGGFALSYAFCTLLCYLSVYYATLGHRGSLLGVCIVLPLVLAGTSIQWLCRPVLFSFLFFSFLYAELRLTAKFRGRTCIRVTLLFLFWANMHPAFVLGLFLLSLRVLFDLLSSRAWRASLCCLLLSFFASLLNPQGYKIYLGIIELGSSGYFQNLNREWLAPGAELGFLPFYILVGLCLFSYLLARKQYSGFEALLVFLFALLSFSSRRFIPYFSLVALGPSIALFTQKDSAFFLLNSGKLHLNAQFSAVLACLLFVLAVFSFATITKPIPVHEAFALYPNRILESLAQKHREGEEVSLLHDVELGGLVTFYFWPRRMSIIDDRNLLFSEEWYQRIDSLYSNTGKDPGLLADRLFTHVILRDSSPLKSTLENSGGKWILVQSEQTKSGRFDLYRRAFPKGPD